MYKDEKEYSPLPDADIITTLDKEPVEVTNPYTGVSHMLTPTETAVFDWLMGSYKLGLMEKFFKGKDWFITNNPKAYYDLID